LSLTTGRLELLLARPALRIHLVALFMPYTGAAGLTVAAPNALRGVCCRAGKPLHCCYRAYFAQLRLSGVFFLAALWQLLNV
jgi:hypothetical protein